MSEQYYTKEDVLPNTSEQAIENFQAQSNSLAFIVPEVAEKMNETGALLYQVQMAAQERGDLGAVGQIGVAWANIERMANQVVQVDAAKQAALEVIKVIDEARVEAEEKLDELETAIHHQDETHPQLKEFATVVREEALEDAMEQAEEYALEYAFEVSYDNISEHLQELTGCSWQQANRFIGILQGDYVISDYQSALLKELLDGLLVERDGEPS